MQFLAGDPLAAQIGEHEVVIRAAGHEIKAAREQRVRQRGGVFHDALRIGAELRLRRLLEADRLGSDDVHERAALRAGEHGAVELFAKLLAREDETAARTAQRLVRGGGHDVGIRHGALVHAARDEPRDVRHIDHEQRAVAVRDVGEHGKVDRARIRRRAGDEQLGMVLLDHVLHGVIVDTTRLGIDAVGDAVVILAGQADPRAVRQMPAAGEIHAHERITGLEQRGVDLEICLRAGMRLDICKLRAEQRLGARDGDALDLVHIFAAAVVAVAGQTLGVFVGQHAAHGGDNRRGGDIFGRDQLDIFALAVKFLTDQRADLGITAPDILHFRVQNGVHGDCPFAKKVGEPPSDHPPCMLIKRCAHTLSFCLRDSAFALHLRHSTQ